MGETLLSVTDPGFTGQQGNLTRKEVNHSTLNI